jgi:hypothetical protein
MQPLPVGEIMGAQAERKIGGGAAARDQPRRPPIFVKCAAGLSQSNTRGLRENRRDFGSVYGLRKPGPHGGAENRFTKTLPKPTGCAIFSR